MLVNCPRCGFQQPKDTYCAQCGIDMDSFKPASPPFLKRLFSSVLIQLGLIGIIAVGVSVFLVKPNKFENQPRFTNARSFLQISNTSSTESASSEQVIVQEAADTTAISTAQEGTTQDGGGINAYRVANPQAAADNREPSEISPTNAAKTTAGANKAIAENSNTAKILVTYAEVSRNTIRRIFDNSRSTGQFMNLAEYSAGIIQSPEKFTSSTQVKILHQEDRTIENIRSVQWSYLLPAPKDAPESEAGLMMYLDFSEADPGSLRGNIEVQWAWRDSPGHGMEPLQRKTFPAFFEIGGETGFFMAGVIPHQARLESESAPDILKILRSPQFKEGESEFVIFIEYKK